MVLLSRHDFFFKQIPIVAIEQPHQFGFLSYTDMFRVLLAYASCTSALVVVDADFFQMFEDDDSFHFLQVAAKRYLQPEPYDVCTRQWNCAQWADTHTASSFLETRQIPTHMACSPLQNARMG